ncbi:MAG TPA: TIGR02679 family protein [Egibacteraceae bacterium]|nr:TIGR02679 family protein [Egibacteraceae bacterium]
MTGEAPLRARAADLVARPGYGELLAAVRARLEAGGDPATVTLPRLGPDGRRALADLLGRREPPPPEQRVRGATLDAALRASRVGAGLVDVLEALGGRLADRRADRARSRAAWDAVWDLDHPALDRPEVAQWLAALRRVGTLRRLAPDTDAAAALLRQALAVVDRLPERAVPLSVLAAETVGDPHALDQRQPLATLVLRAAALMGDREAPTSARGRRQLWAEVGVVCDPLSVSVLVLGLRLHGTDIVADAANDHAGFAVPLRLTLHQLATTDTLRSPQQRIMACENPAVVAAATARLGELEEEAVHPLVCVEGMPDVAADRLLSGLADGGATLAFHADFDWGGLRIGNVLHHRYRAVPWRFTAQDYRAAVAATRSGERLSARSGRAVWDPHLAPAMRQADRAVAEEQLLESLLSDLVPG